MQDVLEPNSNAHGLKESWLRASRLRLLINDAHGMPVVILNHNIAAAYLIPVETFEKLMDAVDDNELKNIVEQRLSAPFASIKVDLDDL